MTGSVVSNISPLTSNSVLPTGASPNDTFFNDTMIDNDTVTLTTTAIPTIGSSDDDFILQKLALASSMCFLVGVVQVLLSSYVTLLTVMGICSFIAMLFSVDYGCSIISMF
jgi:hypothetical protein